MPFDLSNSEISMRESRLNSVVSYNGDIKSLKKIPESVP